MRNGALNGALNFRVDVLSTRDGGRATLTSDELRVPVLTTGCNGAGWHAARTARTVVDGATTFARGERSMIVEIRRRPVSAGRTIVRGTATTTARGDGGGAALGGNSRSAVRTKLAARSRLDTIALAIGEVG